MCKIVPRYALHHRVASSPSALFLPLTFFRFPFIPALLSIFRAFSRACFFWILSILCRLARIFLLSYPPWSSSCPSSWSPYTFFFLYVFSSPLTFPARFSYISRSFFFIFCSYFSLVPFFLRIFLSLANSFPLLILFMSSLFFSVPFFPLSLHRFPLKNASLHTAFLE